MVVKIQRTHHCCNLYSLWQLAGQCSRKDKITHSFSYPAESLLDDHKVSASIATADDVAELDYEVSFFLSRWKRVRLSPAKETKERH